MEFLAYKLLDRPLSTWGTAFLVQVGTLVVLLALRRALRGRLGAMISRLPGKIDDIAVETIGNTHLSYLFAVSIYTGSQWFPLSKETNQGLRIGILIVSILQIGRWVQDAVRRSVEAWQQRAGTEGTQSTHGAAIMFGTNLIVWSLVLLFVLQNLGVEVGALVAGLGVGGVAAAFALQAVLGDLFASLSIYVDRPFDIGDFVFLGETRGTVERVGLRTTRITSLDGEQIIIPNADVTSSRIRNYRRMRERRIVTVLRVPYGTPYAHVSTIPGVIREIIEATKSTRFDRSHFRGYGDFALEFEYVFYALTPDYLHFMEIQQSVNLEIMRRFEEMGVSFAIPTQNVNVRQRDEARDPQSHSNNELETLPASAQSAR